MIEVRPVTADQWQQLRTTRLAALRDTPDAYGSTYEREVQFDESTWRSRTETSRQFFALDGEQPVGLAACFYDPADCTPDERLVVAVWVAPAHRGRRIVGLLLDAIAAHARADGASALLLDVATGNESARRAYLRAGYVATGHLKSLDRDAAIMEERMRLELR